MLVGGIMGILLQALTLLVDREDLAAPAAAWLINFGLASHLTMRLRSHLPELAARSKLLVEGGGSLFHL